MHYKVSLRHFLVCSQSRNVKQTFKEHSPLAIIVIAVILFIIFIAAIYFTVSFGAKYIAINSFTLFREPPFGLIVRFTLISSSDAWL